MFKKLGRGLAHKGGGKSPMKFRFDVQVVQLENLPSAVKNCRVLWSRGAKVQMTDFKNSLNGLATFRTTLTQIATVYSDAKNVIEAKEYTFKVQVPGKGGQEKTVTVGKAELDMARYVTFEGGSQNALVPITFKVGSTSTGYLKLVITSQMLQGDVAEDGMTEVSGITGLTSVVHEVPEQDLSGFEDEMNTSPGGSGRLGKTSRPAATAAAAGSAAAGAAAGSTSARAAAGSAPGSSKDDRKLLEAAKASRARKPADDDEISELSASLDDEVPTSSKSKAVPSLNTPEEIAAARAALGLDSSVSKASSSKAGTSASQPSGTSRTPSAGLKASDRPQHAAKSSIPAAPSSIKRRQSTGSAASSARSSSDDSLPAAAPASLRAASRGAPSGTHSDLPSSIKPTPSISAPPATGSRLLAAQQPTPSPPQQSSSRSARPSSDKDSDRDDAPAASTTRSTGIPPPAPRKPNGRAAADPEPSSEAVKAVMSENEKLKAQLLALKDAQGKSEAQWKASKAREDAFQQQQQEYQKQILDLQASLREAELARSRRHDSSGEVEALRHQVQDLEAQVKELEAARKAAERERAQLKKALSDERTERGELEEQVRKQLEDTADDMAMETVAAYEAKYNRLKTRYKELEEAARDDIEELQEALEQANEHIEQLEAQHKVLEGAREQASRGERSLAEAMQANSRYGSDLEMLREENEGLMHELVGCKLELAQVCEKEIICRRELYKAKETNMKLASKMTKLETLLYTKK